MKEKNLNEILLNIIVFILGLCLVLWAEKVTSLVSMLLGCLAIIYGVIIFIGYFKNNNRMLIDSLYFVYGIIILIIGFILLFRVDFLKELVSFIVGIYIILSSILQLQEILILKKNTNVKLTSNIVLSLVGILVGILCIVGKFIIPDMIVRFIGIMIIIYSILSIVNLIIIRRK